MRGKFLHDRQRLLTRDLFAVANVLVLYCVEHSKLIDRLLAVF